MQNLITGCPRRPDSLAAAACGSPPAKHQEGTEIRSETLPCLCGNVSGRIDRAVRTAERNLVPCNQKRGSAVTDPLFHQSAYPVHAARGTLSPPSFAWLDLCLHHEAVTRAAPLIGARFRLTIAGARSPHQSGHNTSVSPSTHAFHMPCILQCSRAVTVELSMQKTASGAWPGCRNWR